MKYMMYKNSQSARRQQPIRFALRSASLGMTIGTLLSGAGVCAQAAEPIRPQLAASDLVEITGSRLRLKQDQLSGIGPVTVIDRDAIQRSGATTVEGLLQRLSASAGFAGNQNNSYWVRNGYGTAQVNLRGLGINRTLVLLNGRRVVNGGTGANSSVDLNSIPLALIERIDVLKDGASALYGADAVAGVVNIITRQSRPGTELMVRYGESVRGDGEDAAASLSWGMRDERASLIATLAYSENRAVNLGSRAACPLAESGGKLVCSGHSATIGGRAHYVSGPETGKFINFRQSLDTDPAFFEPYVNARHGYNTNPSLNAVNPSQRTSLGVLGTRQLSDQATLFGELLYTQRQSSQLATPGILGLNRSIRLGASHPSNPVGYDLVLDRRRLAEAGPRTFFQETDTWRAVLGLRGQINDNWDWTLAANWGRNTGIDGSTNVANLDRVDATLDTRRCANTANAAIPCANYLGYGNVTPAVLDYILTQVTDTGGNAQKSMAAHVRGQIYPLAAGMVGLASGIEIRRESGWRTPDPLTARGIANTNVQQAVDGSYTARELYGELSIPLLADQPMVQSLHLHTAARYSDYTTFGSKHTRKLGLDWRLNPALKVRLNTSTAFRIPSIPELFGGISSANLTTTDPCSGWSKLPDSSVISQNCRSSGVPAGFTQLGNTLLTTGGANPDLKPEHADTLTAGLVWTPSPMLTLSADYYRIKVANATQALGGSTRLAVCYNTPGLNHVFCSPTSFRRDTTTGEINFLSAQPANVASEDLAGVDLGLLYHFKLGRLPFSLNVDASRLQRYDITPFPGAATLHYGGKLPSGRGSYTHNRAMATLGMTAGVWSGAYSMQYIGSAQDPDAPAGSLGSRIPALHYHNLQVRYAPSRHWDVAAGIDNLFDKAAPFVRNWTDGNTDTMTYDLQGRRWHLRASYRW
ncbi:TonB-dependent receptor [Chitinimonas sp. BJYL2]|uniref:TonB-dependent receptor n=1 Tax=Chitinimonas sp. BJYL2 TaxID=2976696 RepID=UPI0022B3E1E4|nr:TonB-dependent receptor [Chitinimonas sp. BJYL2]